MGVQEPALLCGRQVARAWELHQAGPTGPSTGPGFPWAPKTSPASCQAQEPAKPKAELPGLALESARMGNMDARPLAEEEDRRQERRPGALHPDIWNDIPFPLENHDAHGLPKALRWPTETSG